MFLGWVQAKAKPKLQQPKAIWPAQAADKAVRLRKEAVGWRTAFWGVGVGGHKERKHP